MSKLHITVIASLLAAAAILGAVATIHTVKLGAANHASAAKTIVTRTKQLDKFEASLRQALAKKPPALPKAPTASAALQRLSAVSRTAAAPAPAAAAQPRVIYRRPPAIVVVRHSSHHEDGAESEQSALGAPSGGNDD